MNNSAPLATWSEAGAGGAAPGLHTGEFRRVAHGGLGDPCNAYPHAMAWFRDRLYVGTTRCVLLLIQMRTENMRYWKSFPVRPAVSNAHAEYDTRGQIWRYTPETDRWDLLLVSPRMPERNGVAWPMYHGVRGMIVHRAPGEDAASLYVTTWAPKGGPGVMLLRTEDGERFEEVKLTGIDQERYSSIRALACYNEKVYASPGSLKGVSQNMTDFVRIFETTDPMRQPWRQVNIDNFGDGHNESASDMVVFDGHLYVGTRNPRGFEIWKTKAEGAPPYAWRRVVAGGAGRGPLNETVASFCVFEGALYAGTSISNGGYDRDHGIGPGACEIVRIHPDDSWEVVMGDCRPTPNGFQAPLSGYGPGFDNPCNGYLWRMCAHDGWLYAGTFCAISFLPFLPTERWGEARKAMIETELPEIMEKHGGFDLWRTRDGRCWFPVTRNGFGNEYNYGVRSLLSTPIGLVVGAANPFAPDVGRSRLAGWRFEPNTRGGMEIWIGRRGGHAPAPAGGSDAGTPAPRFGSGDTRLAEDESEAFLRSLVNEFYQGADIRTLGHWGLRVRTPEEAFDDLMGELLAFLPETLGDVLVLDTASPAPAHRLLRLRPASLVVHAASRETGDRLSRAIPKPARVSVQAAPPLPLAGGSVDAVIDAEALSRNPRARDWAAEALRVLRPGGRFVTAAILSDAARAPWRTGPARRGAPIVNAAAFGSLLESIGFRDVRAIEATESCWLPFRRYLDAFERRKMLDCEVDHAWLDRLEQALVGPVDPIAAVVFASGNKG
jgi:SAM-dependent methyltransferase